jgi:hypothetical protein
MGMPWLQRRLFTCTGCGEKLLHDAMYGHWASKCLARPAVRLKHFLLAGRCYHPMAERTR